MRYQIRRYHGDTNVLVGRGYRTLADAERAQARMYRRIDGEDDGSDFIIEGEGQQEPPEPPCRCATEPIEACPRHGIAASNARQNEYWRRVGGHD